MKGTLKNNNIAFKAGNSKVKKKSTKTIFSQESIDIFAKNLVKDLPFMSKYITVNYNKYLLNKHKDKLLSIKNFLSTKSTQKDELSNAFEKLNFIRIKIMLLERDINAYRNALRNTFDAKDVNMILQKKIHSKYAKLRKYDTYQNLNLGVIYDKSILGEKIKYYENEAKKNINQINDKYDQKEQLVLMQKEFIYRLIFQRQSTDEVFKEDVDKSVLREILKQNPKFYNTISNIDTFTNEYLYKNPGALSRSFIKFKAQHKKSDINSVVKDYLDMYQDIHPEASNTTLNEIQHELLSSFNYSTFRSSSIFADMDLAISMNDILLKAKTNFAKMEMCEELEYCLDLPEINNYFKILEAKDRIKNYIVSNERLFVERIEKEFPEIKSTAFIYLYNNVKNTLERYRNDISDTEQYYLQDFISTVLTYEFDDINDEQSVANTLNKISVGIYSNPMSITAKNKYDAYTKLMIQFQFIKVASNIEFNKQLETCKLFHGVLVTDDLKPILPLDIQAKIIHLPLDAQINLAKNYQNTTILDTLDQFYVTKNGDLKLDNKKLKLGLNESTSIQHLSLILQNAKIEEYINANIDNYYITDEINLAKYINMGYREDYANAIVELMSDEKYTESDDYNNFEDNVISETSTTILQSQIQPEVIDVEHNRKNDEVENYRKAKEYIDLIIKEEDNALRAKMLLRIQKRINSTQLPLTEVQIDNLNEILNPINISLRTPKDYVIHLVEKYRSEKRDINSLQVGLKLRLRNGSLTLSDEEIEELNSTLDLSLVQRSKFKSDKIYVPIGNKYSAKGSISDSCREKMANSEALVRNTIKKKSTKLTFVDFTLINILQS